MRASLTNADTPTRETTLPTGINGFITPFLVCFIHPVFKCSLKHTFNLQLYDEVSEDSGGPVDTRSDGFGIVRDLARRFALTFGLDQIKNRESIAALHK